MSRLTLTPHKWSTTKCSLDCVCQNGVWLVKCTDPVCNIKVGYLTGKFPPHYPLPITAEDVEITTNYRKLIEAA